MLKGKTVVLGVTGSIAAYKIANLASSLVKLHADVHVIMTKNATNFINPITFETLTKNKCMTDTFDRNFMYNVAHVSIADKADVMLVAPASANIIAKMAHGIADDMLSTTYLAMKCPVIVSPAMNVNMFTNPVVQRNIKTLEEFGVTVIPPDNGYLACGYTSIIFSAKPQRRRIWQGRGFSSQRARQERVLTLSALSQITPQARWATPWRVRPCSEAPR